MQACFHLPPQACQSLDSDRAYAHVYTRPRHQAESREKEKKASTCLPRLTILSARGCDVCLAESASRPHCRSSAISRFHIIKYIYTGDGFFRVSFLSVMRRAPGCNAAFSARKGRESRACSMYVLDATGGWPEVW